MKIRSSFKIRKIIKKIIKENQTRSVERKERKSTNRLA